MTAVKARTAAAIVRTSTRARSPPASAGTRSVARSAAPAGSGTASCGQWARRPRRRGPLRLAYADPPYPGRSARYYSAHPDYAGEVDHAALLAQLAEFYRWALSTSADALPRRWQARIRSGRRHPVLIVDRGARAAPLSHSVNHRQSLAVLLTNPHHRQ